MIQCQWCPNEFENEELTVLDIDMPNSTVAHMHIINKLCQRCTAATLKAIGEAELEIKRSLGD